jgi:hypothetical protein
VTIYKRANGRWAVQIYDPGLGRSRQVGTYDTKREAKIAEVNAIGKVTAGGSETVGAFAARWTATIRARRRPRTSTTASGSAGSRSSTSAAGSTRSPSRMRALGAATPWRPVQPARHVHRRPP